MSYARFRDNSSVYVYPHELGHVECSACILAGEHQLRSAAAAVAHMRRHIEEGHNVPEELLDVRTYPAEHFVPMCGIFMCLEQADHRGEHTPVGRRREAIRRSIAAAEQTRTA